MNRRFPTAKNRNDSPNRFAPWATIYRPFQGLFGARGFVNAHGEYPKRAERGAFGDPESARRGLYPLPSLVSWLSVGGPLTAAARLP